MMAKEDSILPLISMILLCKFKCREHVAVHVNHHNDYTHVIIILCAMASWSNMHV